MKTYTLYGLYDTQISCTGILRGFFWGKQPYQQDLQKEYDSLNKSIRLSEDFGWKEANQLQAMFRRSDLWDDFPTDEYTLITAEKKVGEEDQRIDLLYLKNDGTVLPCELKVGGKNRDAHGQLIRYIADLHYQTIDFSWIQKKRKAYESTIKNNASRNILSEKFKKFISDHDLKNQEIRLAKKSGILIDEAFTSQELTAVQFLNNECGFSIIMMQVKAFVAQDWSKESDDYYFRIEIKKRVDQ